MIIIYYIGHKPTEQLQRSSLLLFIAASLPVVGLRIIIGELATKQESECAARARVWSPLIISM